MGIFLSLDQREKIPRREARERRLHKIRTSARQVIRSIGPDIGEIAATAAGDENFLANFLGMIDQEYLPTALLRLGGTHEARSTSTESGPKCSLSNGALVGSFSTRVSPTPVTWA